MARLVSLRAREVADGTAADVEVVLMAFRHPDLDAPVYLTSDPTVRLADDPLVYGTRSRWQSAPGAAPVEHYFVIASALMPDDGEDGLGTATLVFDLVDYRMIEPLRSFVRREATVDLAIVMASTPDVVEIEYRLQVLAVQGDAARISLTLGPEDDDQEPHCAVRMTRLVTPALWP